MRSTFARFAVRRFATTIAASAGLAFAGLAHAGTVVPSPPDPGWVHEVFGVQDGLPAAGTLEIVETRDGFLWLATFDGLVRFDGVRFEVYDGERQPALGSDRIVDLLETADGTLWILSEQGHVARLADGRFTACGDATSGPAPCDLPAAGPAAYSVLHEAPDGTLWLGGRSGLYRYEAGRVRRLASFADQSRVRVLLSDHAGRLWVGTRAGLWRRDAGGFTAVDLGNPDDATVGSLVEDSAGTIWVGLEAAAVGAVRSDRFVPLIGEGGHVLVDPAGEPWFALPDRLLRRSGGGLEPVAVNVRATSYWVQAGRAFASDAAGGVWVAWSRHLLREGRPMLRLPPIEAWISSLLVDRAGTVWATTTRSAELHAFRPVVIDALTDGLPKPAVYPVYEDRDGRLWAADRFLAVLEPGAERFRTVDDRPPQRVRALLVDRRGTLWVGTGRGLFTWDDGGYVGPHGPPELQHTHVHSLVEGAGGVLWAGTRAGLFQRDPSGVWSRAGPGDPALARVRVIHEMADGTLWLGTDGGGVARLQRGTLTVVDRTDGLSSDLVRALWPAPDGHLWIATENRGLNRLDPASLDDPGGPEIATLGSAEGLHDAGIHQIVADGLGNLWMSSNAGIFRARLADLDAVAEGRSERVECVVYDERDGMLDRETNGGMQQAGLRDREGRLWFPTPAGVVRIDPRRALRAVEPPPVHIENLRANGKLLPFASGSVELTPDQRSFAISFTAPTSRSPERLRFRYRLLPLDEGWQEAGTRRQAFYTHLPPGRYRFEVAVRGDGLHAPPPATLALLVRPRFFETAWFLAASLLLVAGLAFGAVRLRDARQRRHRQHLRWQVEERTTVIAQQADTLRRIDEARSRRLADLSHQLRTPLNRILASLGEALNGGLGHLPEPLRDQLAPLLEDADRLHGLVDRLPELASLDAGLDATPADDAFLRRVRSQIERRLDDSDFTVEELAAAVGCDRSHLLRRLRTLIDETPSGLIRSLRLRRAAQLLGAGADSVGEIAGAVGFKSVSHFSNAFLECFGERPSAYAARHRNG